MRKSIFYILVAKILWSFSAFLLHVGLGRMLGPEQYGVFGVIMTVISINYLVLGNGVRQAVSKYVAQHTAVSGAISRSGLRLQLLFSIIIAAVFALLSNYISRALGDPSMRDLFLLSALGIPLIGVLFVYSGSLEGMRRFGKSAVVGGFSAVSRLLFVFVIVCLGFKVMGALIGILFSIFLTCVMAAIFCRGMPGDYARFAYGPLIRFALPVLLFFIALAALMHMDIFFAKAMISDEGAIGHYTAAQAISRMLYFFFATFGIILLPFIARNVGQGDSQAAMDNIRSALRYALLLLAPSVAIVSGTSGELIVLLYGGSYIDAGYPLAVLALGISCLSLTLMLSTILQASDSQLLPCLILTGLVVLDAILLSVLIPCFGLIGAALATSISCMFGLILTAFLVFRRFHALVIPRSTLKIVAAASTIFILSIIFRVGPSFLPAYYMILFAVYLFILFSINEIHKEDVLYVKKLLKVKMFP